MKHTHLIIAALCAVMAAGCSTTNRQSQAGAAPQQRTLTRTIPVNPPVVASIRKTFLGSGTPGEQGFENATQIENDVFHAPQYLPGFPTAATIWPRVIEVKCTAGGPGGQPLCDDYEWSPAYGRGEYLYFRGTVAQAVIPVVQPQVIPPRPPAELKKSIRE